MQLKTPVAIFVYNRPGHTQRLLESLECCYRLEECQVFFFSDGPRIPEHRVRVLEVRQLIADWAKEHGAIIKEQSQNLGLARSVVDGVSQLCRDFGRVIVVEDDLVLHSSFLHFMLTGLDRYQDEEQVCQISGYMFPVKQVFPEDACFLPFTTTWGWATWARAWKEFNWITDGVEKMLFEPTERRRFDMEGTYPHSKLLEDRLAGRNQSWGVLFYWSTFRRRQMTLYPKYTLVQNEGFDGSGYHCTAPRVLAGLDKVSDWDSDQNFVFPAECVLQQDAYDVIRRHLRMRCAAREFSFMRFIKSVFRKVDN